MLDYGYVDKLWKNTVKMLFKFAQCNVRTFLANQRTSTTALA